MRKTENNQNLISSADFVRLAKAMDCNTWEEFALDVYSLLLVSEKINAFWNRNAPAWPMQKRGSIEIRSMIGAGLEVLLAWEGLAKWRSRHPYEIPRIENLFNEEKWKTLLDILPLPG